MPPKAVAEERTVAREAVVYGRRLVRRSAAGATKRRASAVALADAVPGEEVEAPGGGRVWLVRGRSAAPPEKPESGFGGVLFFDIESCGLSAAPLFLIGVMDMRDGALDTRQYLARDYSEEGAALRIFAQEAEAATCLVSFNGRSYDLPFMRNRAVQAGSPIEVDLPHTDLLYPARRRWKEELPNCRLATLERHVLDVFRTDDIPGAEIPEAYHEFVRSSDARTMARIIEHNRIDLVSMATLLCRLFPEPWTT